MSASNTEAAAAVGSAAGDTLLPQRHCGNCSTPLLGEHCHACGQPTRGLVRHFTSIVGDFFDSVFDFDARTWRTLGPLLLRPGHLSCEYFEGRRVRYVSPVRLFFFLCIAAFFALQLTIDIGDTIIDTGPGAAVRTGADDALARAGSVEEVERLRAEALAEFAQARQAASDVPGVALAMESAMEAVERQAAERIAELGAANPDVAPPRTGAQPRAEPPAADASGEPRRRFAFPVGDRPWHPDDNPLMVDWLPDVANAALNRALARAEANALRIEDEPRLLVQAFLENLPLTLFLMLPLFALLLKVFFLFKRRLYMEHLIVALHSHAFLCACLLLLALAMGMREWLGDGTLHALLGWVELVLLVWMPLYLLVMQRRVYRQNWLLTVLKFGVLGIAYAVLLSLGTAFALMLSLVTM